MTLVKRLRLELKKILLRLSGAYFLSEKLNEHHSLLEDLHATLEGTAQQVQQLNQQLLQLDQQVQQLNSQVTPIHDYVSKTLKDKITYASQAADTAADIFNHVVNVALKPHHKSVFWGDRLLSLDKSQGFFQDPKFVEAYEQIQGSHQYDQYLSSGGIAWRLCTLVWAARTALNLPGDFVECGVFKGDMSWVIIHCLDFASLPRQFYLYDTFTGLAEKYLRPDDYEANPGYLELSRQAYSIPQLYETVRARFQPFSNVKVIQGILPDVLAEDSPQQIAFLHIDLNSPLAEVGVLDALFDRVVPGGVIVFDDYGWLDFQKQKLAEDEWMHQRGYIILELPTGQGLVIKH
ncbi:MAG: TylF/MycF family methyltransferase [Cyanobacteria bacterium]|nr:TylF/MycF family methyltransferase [Cyanobacteriota bacterium]MDW8200085.1 TylF/MycF/NovP-related O-methyltransferase [Cyanobacteriota bacterium SKYGB_h_bin112]